MGVPLVYKRSFLGFLGFRDVVLGVLMVLVTFGVILGVIVVNLKDSRVSIETSSMCSVCASI